MKKYLVLKEFRPGNVDDLKILAVEGVENITDDRFEGGISSPRTYWAYARYYWLGFDTAAEAEAYREPAVIAYLKELEASAMRQAQYATAILRAHKQ